MKKTNTYRLDLTYNVNKPEGKAVIDLIQNRDVLQYKSVPQYVAAAILHFEAENPEKKEESETIYKELQQLRKELEELKELKEVLRVFLEPQQKQEIPEPIERQKERDSVCLPSKQHGNQEEDNSSELDALFQMGGVI